MRELSETASTLTIHYPMWLGLACLAVTYALSWWFIKTARRPRRRISQIAAGIGGIIVGSVVGYGALTDSVTLDTDGARERRLLTTQAAAWRDVVEVAIEQRTSGKRGMQPHLVLKQAPYGEMAADISGLTPEETQRVLAFARSRAAKR